VKSSATHFLVKFDEDEQLYMFSEIRGRRESEQALPKRSNLILLEQTLHKPETTEDNIETP
jgi:hypothetical protein